MMVKVSTMNSRSAQSFSSELQSSGSFSGMSASASASLESSIKSSRDVSSASTIVTIKGGNRGQDIVNSMDITKATNAILTFASQANEGTTLKYEMHSYQNHPDYTRTLACCKVRPTLIENLNARVSKILITEFIGLKTLENWIDKNHFNLDANTKINEMRAVFTMYDQIRAVASQNRQLTFADVDPFFGRAEEMQQAYLQKYEPKFPVFGTNADFVGNWNCRRGFAGSPFSNWTFRIFV